VLGQEPFQGLISHLHAAAGAVIGGDHVAADERRGEEQTADTAEPSRTGSPKSKGRARVSQWGAIS
jgi:hypothetical protein